MADFIKIIMRKNSLRKQCQELSIEELEKVVSDLTDIIESRREAEEAMVAALKEKEAKIKTIRQEMKAAGVDLNDLMGLIRETSSSTKKKVLPKYRIVENGETHEWSGRGRTPLAFQAYFNRGKTKADCLIED